MNTASQHISETGKNKKQATSPLQKCQSLLSHN